MFIEKIASSGPKGIEILSLMPFIYKILSKSTLLDFTLKLLQSSVRF
jgi:hypothetical protein